MQDQMAKLCGKLVRAEDHHELKAVAAELQRVIRHRINAVRQHAATIALLDRLVDVDAFTSEAAGGSKT